MLFNRSSKRINLVVLLGALLLLVAFEPAFGQTTGFTYQGRLTDGGMAANGVYDIQFKLYDALTNGGLQGSPNTVTNPTVQVTNGIFTVQLDFGPSGFPGADRFLEIGVRLNGSVNPYTVLSPRQPITSTPYAVRSASAANADTATNATNATNATTATNATQLGGVAANQYVVTNDTRLSDARTPTAGSSNYIQNTTNQQASSNFNISGNGTAGGTLSGGTINATTGYDIGGSRVLSTAGATNTFAGISTGENNGGSRNSFFGFSAGQSNTSADDNSFFGYKAGVSNMTGTSNTLLGHFAGLKNMDGSYNTFVGEGAGTNNNSGASNTFVGEGAGSFNTSGLKNTIIGDGADVGSNNLTNATAIGASAKVSQSNSLVLGSINGVNTAVADTSVGIGTTNPQARLHIAVKAGNVLLGDAGCDPSFNGIGFATSLSGCANYSLLGNGTDTIINRPTGGTIFFRENNADQMIILPFGNVRIVDFLEIDNLSVAGATQLCRNAGNQIAACSSSLRYKKDVARFAGGLNIINRLRPISFTWKQGGIRDIGLGAEEVEQVEPLLTFRNDKGEIEGVKYNQLSAVFINAIKEQQAQIKQQQEENSRLKVRLDRLERSLGKLQRSARRQQRKR